MSLAKYDVVAAGASRAVAAIGGHHPEPKSFRVGVRLWLIPRPGL